MQEYAEMSSSNNIFNRFARRCTQALLAMAVAGTLAACGGGGSDAGTPIFQDPTTPVTPPAASTLADLAVLASVPSVPNSGAEKVTFTVTALAAGNTAITGVEVPVSVSVDSGAIVTPSAKVTDKATGTMTAVVQLIDRTSRTVKVTVTSGSISKTASFDVVDSVNGSKVADLALVLDRTSIPNNGSQSVKLTVTTLDASRSAIGGSPVSLKITDVAGGDALVNAGGKTSTDATSGQLFADISLATNHSNREITVTAKSGTVERSVKFAVVDSLVTLPKASDLSMLLDKTNVSNSGGDTVTVTVTAVDSLRNVISGIPITFMVDNRATVAVSGNQTNAEGQVVARVNIGDDKSDRLITVTAKSETLLRTASFLVTGTTLQATALPALPAAGSTGNKIEYRLSDVNKNAMTGLPIVVTLPSGFTPDPKNPAPAVTDANGAYTFMYGVDAGKAGAFDITAVAGGKTAVQTVTVPSGSSTVPDADPGVVSAAVSASPSVVRVNTADTANRSEIRALFLAANNTPRKNVRVRFDLNGDVNSIGGVLSSGTSLVYSDSSGAAITNYTPAQRSSPTNGVAIRACWDYKDFAATACPNQVLTSLTVVSDPLSITIGTDETVGEGDAKLTYVKQYVVLVVDAAGNPVSNVQITPSLDLIGYRKGFYQWDPVAGEWIRYFYLDGGILKGLAPICLSEDLNKNGSIEVGEDKNANGQLDPRKSDASISMVGSTKTNTNGIAILKIEYPKSVGSWVDFTIQASAAGVLSPPAIYSSLLPISASVLKAETPPPAFVNSPYGIKRKSADLFYCTNSD
jgi:hypothetical protein